MGKSFEVLHHGFGDISVKEEIGEVEVNDESLIYRFAAGKEIVKEAQKIKKIKIFKNKGKVFVVSEIFPFESSFQIVEHVHSNFFFQLRYMAFACFGICILVGINVRSLNVALFPMAFIALCFELYEEYEVKKYREPGGPFDQFISELNKNPDLEKLIKYKHMWSW